MGDNSGRTVKLSSSGSSRVGEWMDEGGGFKTEGWDGTDGIGVGTEAGAVLGLVFPVVMVVDVVVVLVVKVVGRLEVVAGRVGAVVLGVVVLMVGGQVRGVVVLVVGGQVRGEVVVEEVVVRVAGVASVLVIAVGGQV